MIVKFKRTTSVSHQKILKIPSEELSNVKRSWERVVSEETLLHLEESQRPTTRALYYP